MGEKAKVAPLDLGLLEEDDEFEEFPAEGGFLTIICVYAKSFINVRL